MISRKNRYQVSVARSDSSLHVGVDYTSLPNQLLLKEPKLVVTNEREIGAAGKIVHNLPAVAL